MRYFIEIAYKGTAYHGWQIQANAPSVQAELQRVLSIVLQHPVALTGSGRTDKGVHATQQFAHFDSPLLLDARSYLHKFNALLPKDIAIHTIQAVQDVAHARFDATARSYEYRIVAHKTPFAQGLTYFFPRPLDVERMNQAAAMLLAYQDFESFSRVQTEVNNFLCHITRAEWELAKDMLIFHITANRFLRGMVRAIVGTLLEVGLGKMTVQDFETIIALRDRRKAGRAAPPEGLFLTLVSYPSDIFIPITPSIS